MDINQILQSLVLGQQQQPQSVGMDFGNMSGQPIQTPQPNAYGWQQLQALNQADANTPQYQQNMQMPASIPMNQNMGGPQMPVASNNNISSVIQQQLGAIEPSKPNLAGDILASRFEDLNSGPSYGDFGEAIAKSAGGKVTTGSEVYDARSKDIKTQLATIERLNALGRGGGNSTTMMAINGLMAADPTLTFEEALYKYQTGLRQGTQLDSRTKTVAPLAGLLDTKQSISHATKLGGQNAILETAGPIEAAKTVAGEQAKATTQAQIDLPKIADQAQVQFGQLDNLLNSPGLDANFGVAGYIPNRAGSDAANASALIEQVKGGGFLTAYGLLRGGGQISNVEGDKATAAYVRMQTAQSAPAFREALQEYKHIIGLGLARARNLASGATFNQSAKTSEPNLNDPGFQEFLRNKGVQ